MAGTIKFLRSSKILDPENLLPGEVMENKCSECGKELSANANLCPFYGKQIKGNFPNPKSENSNTSAYDILNGIITSVGIILFTCRA